jgi:catechol 2,3-dioxygenase
MQRSYPGALFVAAGGYHHHLGLNIWAGQDAPPPPADAVGLRAYGIHIPDESAWQEVAARLEKMGRKVEKPESARGKSALVQDQDGNTVELRTQK